MNFSNSSHLSVVLGGALVFLIALAVLPTVLQHFNQSSVLMTEAGHCTLNGERFTTVALDWQDPATIFGVEVAGGTCQLDAAGRGHVWGSTETLLTPNGAAFATVSGGGVTYTATSTTVVSTDLIGPVDYNLAINAAVLATAAAYYTLINDSGAADHGFFMLPARWEWTAGSSCSDTTTAYGDVTAVSSIDPAVTTPVPSYLMRDIGPGTGSRATRCVVDDTAPALGINTSTVYLVWNNTGNQTADPDRGFWLLDYNASPVYRWNTIDNQCWLGSGRDEFDWVTTEAVGSVDLGTGAVWPVTQTIRNTEQWCRFPVIGSNRNTFTYGSTLRSIHAASGSVFAQAVMDNAEWKARPEVLSQQPRLNSTIINMLPLVILVAGLLAAGGWIYNARRSSG